MDGSLGEDAKTPLDFEANVAVTKEVVDYAHARGVTVEGELGTLGGIEDGVGSGEICLTDPAQAEEFVERTGVDALAVAIGTSHGAYKFSREPDGDILAMEIIEDIHRRLPDTHIVMHGSSSVPADIVERVKAAGGEVDAGFGVPISAIQRGIEHGVRKVNIDTDGRLAITAFMREHFLNKPGDWDPRGPGKAARAGQKLHLHAAHGRARHGRPRRRLRAALARADGRALRRGRAHDGLGGVAVIRHQLPMIDVAFLGADVRPAATAVVIDVLRATTTITLALASGYERVLVAGGHRRRRAALRADGRVLAGERDCERPPGFDLGNSPEDTLTPLGPELILATTNGAPAILGAVAACDEVLVACLLNEDAVVEALSSRTRRHPPRLRRHERQRHGRGHVPRRPPERARSRARGPTRRSSPRRSPRPIPSPSTRSTSARAPSSCTSSASDPTSRSARRSRSRPSCRAWCRTLGAAAVLETLRCRTLCPARPRGHRGRRTTIHSRLAM